MKCGDCGQDILQTHPEMCPYCRSKNLISEEDETREAKDAQQLAKAGRYEEAALKFEKLDLWDEAKACRLQAKKSQRGLADLQTGKVSEIHLVCPHCGSSQRVNSKTDQETCSRCGTTYLIPREVLNIAKFED